MASAQNIVITPQQIIAMLRNLSDAGLLTIETAINKERSARASERVKSLFVDKFDDCEELEGYKITKFDADGFEERNDCIRRMYLSVTFTKGLAVSGSLSETVIKIDIRSDDNDCDPFTHIDVKATSRNATKPVEISHRNYRCYCDVMDGLLEDDTSLAEFGNIQEDVVACLKLIRDNSREIGL